jgi:fructokinase
MNKILCIGEALIDMICIDKGKLLSDGDNFLKKPGGAPTNVAAAIAALGGTVQLAAKVGADPFGKHLIDVMNQFGVHTQTIFKEENSFTTFAFVSLMPNGERDFYFNRGADGLLTAEDIDTINLNAFSIVHFGSATAFLPGPLQRAYNTLLQKAISRGLYISFDPNYRSLLFADNIESFKQQSWEYINQCNFFKVSDEEAFMLTDTDNIADAAHVFLQKTNAVFAITIGKDGTMLGLKGNAMLIPSIAVTPVDTTGAGDAFVGAVLYQLSKNNKIPDGIETWNSIIFNANKAGARTCEYMGAMEAFKHLSNKIFN